MDYSLLGSSVHGILQARILEGVAISLFRGSSRPRNWTRVLHCRQILYRLSYEGSLIDIKRKRDFSEVKNTWNRNENKIWAWFHVFDYCLDIYGDFYIIHIVSSHGFSQFLKSPSLLLKSLATRGAAGAEGVSSPCCARRPRSPAASRCRRAGPYAPCAGSAGSAGCAVPTWRRCYPEFWQKRPLWRRWGQWYLKETGWSSRKSHSQEVFVSQRGFQNASLWPYLGPWEQDLSSRLAAATWALWRPRSWRWRTGPSADSFLPLSHSLL